MPRIDNRKFYLNAIKLHGESAKGLNWNSSQHQLLRFEALLSLLPDDLSALSIVDAGCGFGDFYHYLRENKREPKQYIGIDSLSEMCAIATKNTAQEIINADICKAHLPKADYYICSGALNILTPYESIEFILNCYKSSKKAFLFNALCAEKISQTYNYFKKQNIQRVAKELHVRELLFKSGYLANDISVGFYK